MNNRLGFGSCAVALAMVLGACGSSAGQAASASPQAFATSAAKPNPSGSPASAAASAGARPAASSALQAVNIAVPGPSSAWGFLYVAQEQGLFAKNGLRATITETTTTAYVPGLVSDSFQALPVAGTAERAALAGQPIVNVMSVSTTATVGLVVKKDITAIPALAGKTIVTSSAGSSPYEQLQQFLDNNGLTGKVNVLQLPSVGAQIAGFATGDADALFLTFDAVVVASGKVPGSKIMLTPSDLKERGAASGLAMARAYVTAHPDTARALIRSVYEATKFELTQPDQTKAIFTKSLGLSPDQASYVYTQETPTTVLQPRPTDEQLQTNASADSKALKRTVTVEDLRKIWDTALAEQVFKELNCPNVCSAA